jgi:hypothetical protein
LGQHGRESLNWDVRDQPFIVVPYLSKVVLHCTCGVPRGLPELVEAFIRDGVKYVGVVGKDAGLTEEIIDEHAVGDGSDEHRYILTASHENESLEYALEFARNLTSEFESEVQLVELKLSLDRTREELRLNMEVRQC